MDTSSSAFSVSSLTSVQAEKIQHDLRFISALQQVTKSHNCRMVISGGYAVDGHLQKISRHHNDIDIQLFGQQSASVTLIESFLHQVKEADSLFSNIQITKQKQEEYYTFFQLSGDGFLIDLYYIQVNSDPFNTDKQVVKADGSLSEKQIYETQLVTLEDVTFEAISPLPELLDKLYKREIRGDEVQSKHTQDINNLSQIVDMAEIKRRMV